MKFKYDKVNPVLYKSLSLLLSTIMVLSVFAVMLSVVNSTAKAETGEIDYSSSNLLKSNNWTVLEGAENSEVNFSGDSVMLNISAGNNYEYGGKQYTCYTVGRIMPSDIPEKAKITSVSYSVLTGAEQAKRPLEIIYDYTSKNNYKALGISGNKTSSLKVYQRNQSTYLGEGTGSACTDTFTAKDSITYKATYNVKITYSYNAGGKTTCTVVMSQTNAKNTLTLDLGEVETPCAILSGGSSAGTNIGSTYGNYTNVKVAYYKQKDMSGYVSNFKITYPIVSAENINSKNAESCKAQAEAAINARNGITDTDEYSSLGDYIAECNTVLIKCNTIINNTFSDSFDDSVYTAKAFKSSQYNFPDSSSATEVANASFSVNNGLLKVSGDSTTNRITTVYELDAAKSDGVSMLSTKFFCQSGVLVISSASQRLMYLQIEYGSKNADTGRLPVKSIRLETFYNSQNKSNRSNTILDNDAAWTTDVDNPEGWLSALISINDDGYPVVNILNSEGIKIASVMGNSSYFIVDRNKPCAFSVRSGTTYIDDINIFYNLDQSLKFVKSKKKFLSDHSELLMLNNSTVTAYYIEEATRALESYESLPSSDPLKYALIAEAAQIRSLLKYMTTSCDDSYKNYVRAKDDYSDFTEDFENGLTKWYTKGNVSICDYEDYSSKALQLSTGSSLIPKTYVLPEKASVKTISFKMKIPNGLEVSNVRQAQICYNYKDSKNYEVMELYYNDEEAKAAGKVTYRFNKFINGEETVFGRALNDFVFNFKDWFTVKLTYDGNNITFEMDDGQNYVNKNITRDDITGIFALTGFKRSDHGAVTLYDDFVVTLDRGDWDVDLPIDRIYTYYNGNTQVNGDETVMITGEDLCDTVYGVRVLQLENNNSTTPGYILQGNHNYSAIEGTYYHSVENSVPLDSNLWNTSSEKISIIQATDDGIKFTLPQDFTTGIYAVKLYGYDDMSNNDDSIIYINSPHIEGATGDEGEIATHGGYIQFTGDLLALDVPTENNDYVPTISDKVKIRIKNSENEYNLNATILSPYSVKGEITADIPYGTYEAVLYNGYGDDTCWSQPYTIKIGASPRESWPKTVFNILDYGATGNKEQNATPCVVNALTDLQQNGGGILYFPKGIYNLFHSVVIPENVVVTGDGEENSIIFWSPDQWKMGKLLSYQIGVTNNVEIENIGFYGTRLGSIIKFFGSSSKNLYFHDLLVYVNPYSGAATETGGAVLEGDIWNSIMAELKVDSPFVWRNEACFNEVVNLQIDNINFENTTEYVMRRMTDLRNCKHAKVTNSQVRAGWSLLWGRNTIWSNNVSDASTLAILGENVYFSNSTLKNRVDNNRELFVADWSAGSFSGACGAVLKEVKGSNGLKYTVNKAYASGFLERGYQIFVTSGQGRGQTRTIVNNSGNTIEISTPFIIPPNSNSRVTIRTFRQNNYFVDNYYFNGSAGGYFGGYANVVYDSNNHQRHSNFYQSSRTYDSNWYTSYVNEKYYDPYVFYKYGSENSNTDNTANGGDNSGYGYIVLNGQNFGGSLGHIFRHNDYDGYYISFNANINNAISDIVVEKNTFENVNTVIYNSSNNVLNGILYRENFLFNTSKFTSQDVNSVANTQGYAKQIVDGGNYEKQYILGDVNGDGVVSIKDCTILKCYFAELISLTEDQLSRCDMNKDGRVSLTDVSAIRKFILFGHQTEEDDQSSSSSVTSSSSSQVSSEETEESSSTESQSSQDDSSQSSSDIYESQASSSSSEPESSESESSPGYFPGNY